MGPSAKPVYSRLLGKCLDLPEIRAQTMLATSTTMTIVTATGRVRNRIAYRQIVTGSVIVKTTLPICPDFVRVVGEIPGTRFRTIPYSCATPSPGRTTVFFRVIRGGIPRVNHSLSAKQGRSGGHHELFVRDVAVLPHKSRLLRVAAVLPLG